MSWPNSDSTYRSSSGGRPRPSRPSYVPPHQRSSTRGGGGFSFNNVFHSPDSYANANRFHGNDDFGTRPSRGRGGGRAGFGRGVFNGGGGRGEPRNTSNPNRVEQNPFDVIEKFGDLGVNDKEEEVVNGGGGINFEAYEDIPVETSGKDVPSPVNTFAEIDLGEALNLNIQRCKYVKPTPVQRHAIPISIAGRDLMACAQTGSGKTAAFCFPIISGIIKKHQMSQTSQSSRSVACPLALIISPTRELSIQIYEEVKKFSYETGVKVAVAYGGSPMHQQLRDLERGVDILVATPGRLVDMIERARVSLRLISYLALDEADRMLDMGFEPQIRKIVEQMDMPRPGVRQTMLFSATFPTEIQQLASDFLSNYIFLTVGRVGSSTDLIEQRIEYVEDGDKRSHLMDLLHAQKHNGLHGKQALTVVFVETKRGADNLERWLNMNGFPATAIHGDKVQMERERALRMFKKGATPILVATDVAARGLDIPHVAHVVNFDLPKDIDDYVHRIGRTGRAGNSGLATAFFNEGNQSMAKPLADLMQEANQEVPSWLTECAQKPSYGGGRSRRYGGGGSRFGGYDYRRDSPSSADYGYAAAPPYNAGTDSFPPPLDYGYGNGPVEVSGWD
ncbi:RNA helicase [Ranunculus cassubicifolius]